MDLVGTLDKIIERQGSQGPEQPKLLCEKFEYDMYFDSVTNKVFHQHQKTKLSELLALYPGITNYDTKHHMNIASLIKSFDSKPVRQKDKYVINKYVIELYNFIIPVLYSSLIYFKTLLEITH